MAAAVGALVWWTAKDSGKEGPEGGNVDLIGFRGGAIRKIEIRRTDETIVLEKRDARWWIATPRETPALEQAMSTVLPALDLFNMAERLPPGQTPDPAAHGLDSPALDVTLAAADGKTVRLQFGKSTGLARQSRIYVRVHGTQDILVADEQLFRSLDRSFAYMRDTGLCRFSFDDLLSVSCRTGGEVTGLARRGKGWQVTGAVEDLADPAAVEEWAGGAVGLATAGWQAKASVPGVDFGFDAPHAALEFRLGARTVVVTVGAPIEEGGNRRWAQTSEYPDDVGTVREADLAAARIDPAKLRAKHAFPFPLKSATVYRAGGPVDVEACKKGEKWEMVRPPLLAGFWPGRVDELLAELGGLEVAERLTPASPPADAVSLAIGWGDRGAECLHEARLWRAGEDVFVASENPARLVRCANRAAWDHVDAGAQFLRNPLLIEDLVPLQLQAIEVERDGRPWFRIENAGRAWTLKAGPPGKTLDAAKAAEFSQVWTSHVADTWVRDSKDADATGLKTPRFKITLVPDPSRATNATERVILLGSDGPRHTLFGMVEGVEGVFLADPNAAGRLRQGVFEE
jgi:hypothetical protein